MASRFNSDPVEVNRPADEREKKGWFRRVRTAVEAVDFVCVPLTAGE